MGNFTQFPIVTPQVENPVKEFLYETNHASLRRTHKSDRNFGESLNSARQNLRDSRNLRLKTSSSSSETIGNPMQNYNKVERRIVKE